MALSSTDGRQNNQRILTARDIAFIAMFAAILFIQEEALTFIPNVQLTVFFIVLYAKKLGFVITTFIVAIHVVMDNIVMGSFNMFYTPAMFIGWMFIPIIICAFCRKIENQFILGIIGAICSFLYCWVFIIPNVIVYHINPLVYLASDIIFELVLAACGFITISFLYKPCSTLFDRFGVTRSKKDL